MTARPSHEPGGNSRRVRLSKVQGRPAGRRRDPHGGDVAVPRGPPPYSGSAPRVVEVDRGRAVAHPRPRRRVARRGRDHGRRPQGTSARPSSSVWARATTAPPRSASAPATGAPVSPSVTCTATGGASGAGAGVVAGGLGRPPPPQPATASAATIAPAAAALRLGRTPRRAPRHTKTTITPTMNPITAASRTVRARFGRLLDELGLGQRRCPAGRTGAP